jgi:hypothetical protein
MSFTKFLQLQLTNFVEVYKKFYVKTLSTTLVFTLVFLALTIVLMQYSFFDKESDKKISSLVSYIFYRYSYGDTYSVVDMSKTVFLFIVTIFSVALNRLSLTNPEMEEYHFSHILKMINWDDIGYCVIAFIMCLITDYLLVKLDYSFTLKISDQFAYNWIYHIFFMLRLYIPLILFSFVNYKTLTRRKIDFNLKKILLLFVALWLFNEFSYELFAFAKFNLFNLILIPFPLEIHFVIESILCVPLLSFLFLGYHSAMSYSMNLLYNNNDEEIDQIASHLE